MTSHETACLLNVSDQDAHVRIMIYFSAREPVGPYQIIVPANRTNHVRFNDLKDPEPVPRGTEYASVIESDVPIVLQRTRLDSRRMPTLCLRPSHTRRWSDPCWVLTSIVRGSDEIV